MEDRRTVLLVPSELVSKTISEAEEYLEHWDFQLPEIIGYGTLSHRAHADALEKANPEMIIADEGHALGNLESACTARVGNFLAPRPDCVFGVLGGSLMGESLL